MKGGKKGNGVAIGSIRKRKGEKASSDQIDRLSGGGREGKKREKAILIVFPDGSWGKDGPRHGLRKTIRPRALTPERKEKSHVMPVLTIRDASRGKNGTIKKYACLLDGGV